MIEDRQGNGYSKEKKDEETLSRGHGHFKPDDKKEEAGPDNAQSHAKHENKKEEPGHSHRKS